MMTARSGAARQPPQCLWRRVAPDVGWAATSCTIAQVQRRSLVATMAALALLLAACSSNSSTGTGTGPGQAVAARADAPPTESTADSLLPPIFVQHGLTGSVEVNAGEPVVVVRGVDPIMVALGSEDGSTLSIEDFHSEWDDIDAEPAQAAVVFGDPEHEPALVSLSEPSWNPTTRTVTYGIGVPTERDPRLDGIAPTGATLPDEFDLVTLYVTWPGPDTVPAPTTTTTTAPTTTTTTIPPTLPPVATTTRAPAPSPTVPTPTPTAPATNPPLPGPALIGASPDVVVLPSAGGSSTFTLRNSGSGPGSWTVRSIASQGISASPSSGILLASGATTITVTYNGHGPADDFLDELKIVTSSGTITVKVIVGG